MSHIDPHTEMFVATPKGKIIKRLTNTEGYDAEGALIDQVTGLAPPSAFTETPVI